MAENLPHEQIDGLKKMFNDMDKDKNGALTYEELKDGLTSIGDQPVADPDIEMFMEAVSISYMCLFHSFVYTWVSMVYHFSLTGQMD